MLNSQVLQRCRHGVLQLLPQAVQLEILASGRSLGSLLAVVLQLLLLLLLLLRLKLGWAAGWALLPLHHIQLLHNLDKWTQDKVNKSYITGRGASYCGVNHSVKLLCN